MNCSASTVRGSFIVHFVKSLSNSSPPLARTHCKNPPRSPRCTTNPHCSVSEPERLVIRSAVLTKVSKSQPVAFALTGGAAAPLCSSSVRLTYVLWLDIPFEMPCFFPFHSYCG